VFFVHPSQSNNAETASQALFDLRLQLTPLLEKWQHSTPSKTLPPMTGSIAQADLYGTAPLCIQRHQFMDSKPKGSLNTFQCTQTLFLPTSPIIVNSNSLNKGTTGINTSNWPISWPPTYPFQHSHSLPLGKLHDRHIRLLYQENPPQSHASL
jgi:hypothetical protein